MRKKTPIRLSAIPVTPLQVIRSLITMADIISVIIGLSVLIMEASIAVVLVMANKKDNCVMKSPRKEAITTFQISFLSNCSCCPLNKDHNQKRIAAPNDLRQNKAIGVVLPSIAMFLQQIMLKPIIAYAVKHARFPIIMAF